MQAYVNKFSIALNQDKTEAIINFFQNVPVIPQNEGASKMTVRGEMPAEVIPVVNLVMTGECAHNFARMLLDLLDQEPPIAE